MTFDIFNITNNKGILSKLGIFSTLGTFNDTLLSVSYTVSIRNIVPISINRIYNRHNGLPSGITVS